ncbi:MAG: hypothetical protein ABJB85_11685 [Nitrososphaerota archaeon]
MRLNEFGEELDLCSACKIGYLKLTGEVVVKGESAAGYGDVGTRRVFKCDNCDQRQVIVGHQEYVRIGDDVKTKFIEDKS